MISGGGSAQVDPPGPRHQWQEHVWFPTSPLKAVARKLRAPTCNSIQEITPSAAALAKNSDVALVFVSQWESEDMDLPNLSFPDNQDALMEQVAAANPHTSSCWKRHRRDDAMG